MTFDRLDLVSKLYQPSGWPRVLEAAAGKRSSGPLVVDLDPTTFCDLACPECISGKLLNQGRFTPERLAELADELIQMSVRGVVLIGGGEPLAHRGTRKVLRMLGEAGVAIGVVTNGTMIQQNLDELAEYASWVRVSMDAGTRETYGIFRPDRKGRSVFDKVIGNMRMLAEVKKGALGYSFLVMTRQQRDGTVVSNHHEVLEAAGLAKDIGCDYFETKAMFDDGHHVIQVADDILGSVDDQLARAEEKWADDSFEIINSSTLTSLRNRVGAVQPKEYHQCQVAELRTLITPSGVYVCSYHRGNAQAKIGDAVTERMQDIWLNSDRGIIDPTRDCRFHCARHRSNLELEKIAAEAVTPEMGGDYDPFI